MLGILGSSFSRQPRGLQMLGIPYRVHQLTRIRMQRERRAARVTATLTALSRSRPPHQQRDMEAADPAPIPIIPSRNWTAESKFATGLAGFVLMIGMILTFLSMNNKSSLYNYRTVMYVILGILFIIVGPLLVCRMVLNSYRRRLRRDERRLANLTREVEVTLSQRQRLNLNTRSYPLASSSNPASRMSPQIEMAFLFPDKLPSYQSALNLHRFEPNSSDVPPPPYQESAESEVDSEPAPAYQARVSSSCQTESIAEEHPMTSASNYQSSSSL